MTFRASETLAYSTAGNRPLASGFGSEGKEYLANDGTENSEGFVTAWLWLGPGSEAVFRVELAK